MFNAKKVKLSEVSVQDLAQQLGIERRLNFRVNYPERTTAGLPRISFRDHILRVQDISVGGCCLIDVGQIMGGSAGHDIELKLHFDSSIETVQARLLTLVNDRRHIQFSNLPVKRQDQLRDQMLFGVRGSTLRANQLPSKSGPALAAREMWSSLQGDALVFELQSARDAQAEIAGDIFNFYSRAWPTDRFNQPVSPLKLNSLILFISNISHPSTSVVSLMRQLEDLALEAP